MRVASFIPMLQSFAARANACAPLVSLADAAPSSMINELYEDRTHMKRGNVTGLYTITIYAPIHRADSHFH